MYDSILLTLMTVLGSEINKYQYFFKVYRFYPPFERATSETAIICVSEAEPCAIAIYEASLEKRSMILHIMATIRISSLIAESAP